MNAAIIIPSRFASERLPHKALHLINDRSLIERVHERCLASGLDVYVATDHPAIEQHVLGFGGNVLLTSADCASGTDRVAAASAMLGDRYDFVINVQGDEPLIDHNVIRRIAETMQSDSNISCATPITPIVQIEDLTNPNIVKVVFESNMDALYFSRNAIPFLRDLSFPVSAEWLATKMFYKHIGLYAYRPSVLKNFVMLPESPLELAERLEQLRLLQAGIRIKCVVVDYESIAVDTLADIGLVERALIARGEA